MKTARMKQLALVQNLFKYFGRSNICYRELKQVIAANKFFEFNQDVVIKNPQLWSCESPVLYTAVTSIYNNDKLLSTDTNSFGIRKISFDVSNGFQLNGKPLN